MRIIKFTLLSLIILVIAGACKKDIGNLDALDDVKAPQNVAASFDITQDNTGFVTAFLSAEGVTSYRVLFGDDPLADPVEYGLNDDITHTYTEGVYTVGITAVGLTGLTTTIEKELNVTYKAPENLVVTIEADPVNPKIINFSAKADYATIIDFYFGDTVNEEPTHALPEEVISHTYAVAGDYDIKVIAKSAAEATTEYTHTITITAAADPVILPITFESYLVNYQFTDFGNVVSLVIDNPDPTGINTSSRVASSLKIEGAETWAGTFLTLGEPIDFSTNKVFKVKTWAPKAGITVKLKVENLTNSDIWHEVDVVNTTADQWEELSFDFSEIDIANEYQKVVIFFDFDVVGDDNTYFFDDFKLVPGDVPSTLMVQDFEGVAPEFTSFGNIDPVEVVANPDPSGINTTANTAKMIKNDGSETWAGAFLETDKIDFDNFNKFQMKIWSPKNGIPILFKLENADASIVHEVSVTNTTANAWEQLVYDFSDAPAADYVKIVVFFDFDAIGDGSTYYFDEIEMANDGGGTSSLLFQDFEGTPPTFTSFGNIADIEVINNPDASGVNTTAQVAQMVKNDGSETWAGAFFETDMLDLVTYSKIKVSAWSPKSDIPILLKLENADASIVHEVQLTNTTANAWENITYDFSDAPTADYTKVVIFFDFGTAGDDAVYYFDQFELTN